MPMSGSNYVAPTWVDNAPPAISASELQAICDAIVNNQGDVTSLQSTVAAISSLAYGSAQLVSGSYVGTGTYGSSNPTSLTFSKRPMLLIVSQSGVMIKDIYISSFIWVPGSNILYIGTGDSNSMYCTFSQSGNKVSWYSSVAVRYQLNVRGTTYRYIALLK